MKKYMILKENPIEDSSGVQFFNNFGEAMDFVEASRDDGYYVEVYERRPIRFEGRTVGFEYRRVD